MSLMRAALITISLLLLAAPASAGAAPRAASVALTECATSAAPAERAAAFEARMRARRPGQRLQMRFVLQSRERGERAWRRVEAPGWGAWVTADPGVGRYVYEKRVESLAAPAFYRAVVRFRWSSALGEVERALRVPSPVCRQPDLRPDLQPVGLQRSDERYLVTIHNAGRSVAAAFDVVLTVNGRAQAPQTVFGLAAGERTTLALRAPACEPGSTVSILLDPRAQVDERDELDNSASLPCPTAWP